MTAAELLERLRATRTVDASSAHRRDPRTAPLVTLRNQSVPESGEFYGVADGLTKCRFPRSCSDCLAKPGCMLDMRCCCSEASAWPMNDTLAVGLAALRDDPSSHQPLQLAPLTSSNNVFFAENATYCPASDPVCSVCRASFETLTGSEASRSELPLQFCIGSNGCVCSGVCEVPAYQATLVWDANCGQPRPVYQRGGRPPLRVFSSKRRDPRTPLLPTSHARTVDETCGFHEELDIRGCRESRNASACLQRKGCVFTTEQCTDVKATSNATDFHSSSVVDLFGSDLYYSQLVAGNTTICGGGDAACSACGSSIIGLGEIQKGNSWVSCIGTNGCLCSDLVRYFDDHQTASDSQCRLAPIPQNTTAMWSVATLLFVVLVPVWIMALIYGDPTRKARVAARAATRLLQYQATRVMRHMLDAVPGGFDLDLFGWRQHQRRLRYKEQQLLEGYENLSPVAGPVEYEAFPSAPEFDDEEEASAPTRQDPMALASAPVFASRAETALDSHAVPSAPDFDD